MTTVAIIEGFSGGPMHTRGFRKALASAGFQIIKDRRRADIIIAHSAGIYVIPDDSRAKLLVLIGPTYWPGQSIIKRIARHNKSNQERLVGSFGWPALVYEKLFELYYFFRRPKYIWIGLANNNDLTKLRTLVNRSGRHTIIIRNSNDPLSSPRLKSKLPQKNLQYIQLQGGHSDYYHNPKPYIDLILKNI